MRFLFVMAINFLKIKAHFVRSHTCHKAHRVLILTLAEHAGLSLRGVAAIHAAGPETGCRQPKECTTMKNPSAVWVVLAPLFPAFALGLAYAIVYATRM